MERDLFLVPSNPAGRLSVTYTNPRYDGGRFTLSPQEASAFSISPFDHSNRGVLKAAETSDRLYYITSMTGVSNVHPAAAGLLTLLALRGSDE
jgi:hypothetical protein